MSTSALKAEHDTRYGKLHYVRVRTWILYGDFTRTILKRSGSLAIAGILTDMSDRKALEGRIRCEGGFGDMGYATGEISFPSRHDVAAVGIGNPHGEDDLAYIELVLDGPR